MSILDEKSAGLKKGDMFDGDTAFTLYDTYGFPLDLTQDALKSRGISVDQASFTDAMERQRAKARASWSGSGDTASENVWFPLREKLGATEFLGYDTESAEGVVTALVKDGKDADSLKAGESGAIVLNQTPFYAESGGQVGDTGMLTGEGVKFRVTDTQKKAGDLFVHLGTVEQGTLKVGHRAAARSRSCAGARRSAPITRRRICCTRRCGRCSAITSPSAARWWRRIGCASTSCIRSRSRRKSSRRVEDIANEVVLENDEVTTRLMAVDDAREAGARALFGEKYGDEVRVVSMGKGPREQGQNALGWSVELCGGTHVRRTGDIGLISVTGESAVASGVRRIEALTGRHARKHANDTMALAKTAASELRTSVDDMPARIAALMEERKKLERDLSDARKKLAMGGGADRMAAAAAGGVREVGDVKLLARAVEGIETKDLKSLVDDGKKQTRLRRGRDRRRHRGRQGRHRRRRHRRSHLALQRGRTGAQGAPKRSAARAAAAGPTWRRPAGPMAPRPTRRCRRSNRRWPAPSSGASKPV